MPIPKKKAQDEKVELNKVKITKKISNKGAADSYVGKAVNQDEDLILDKALEDIYDFSDESILSNQFKQWCRLLKGTLDARIEKHAGNSLLPKPWSIVSISGPIAIISFVVFKYRRFCRNIICHKFRT